MTWEHAASRAGQSAAMRPASGLSLAVSFAAAVGRAEKAYVACAEGVRSTPQRRRRQDADGIPVSALDRIREGVGRP